MSYQKLALKKFIESTQDVVWGTVGHKLAGALYVTFAALNKIIPFLNKLKANKIEISSELQVAIYNLFKGIDPRDKSYSLNIDIDRLILPYTIKMQQHPPAASRAKTYPPNFDFTPNFILGENAETGKQMGWVGKAAIAIPVILGLAGVARTIYSTIKDNQRRSHQLLINQESVILYEKLFYSGVLPFIESLVRDVVTGSITSSEQLKLKIVSYTEEMVKQYPMLTGSLKYWERFSQD